MVRPISPAEREKAESHMDKMRKSFLNGRKEEAMWHVDRALRIIPNSPDFLTHKACILESMGEAEAARETVGEAFSGKRKPTALAHFVWGRLEAKEGNTQHAIEHFEKAVELEPDNPSYHANLSDLYFSLGKIAKGQYHSDKSRDILNEAIRGDE